VQNPERFKASRRPAMAAGGTNTFWTVRDLVEMMKRERAPRATESGSRSSLWMHRDARYFASVD
jgi:hypothetical protein